MALFTRTEPLSVKYTLGIEGFDDEHRAIVADYGEFLLFNVYFPNGKASQERLEYKLRFYDLFLEHIDRLKAEGRRIVICGDINTAHKEIDLARPKANEKISGFLAGGEGLDGPAGGSGLSRHLPHLSSEEGESYSWWDLKTRARERNVGWRIDYFFVSENQQKAVQSAFILKDVTGADHCPVGIELEIDSNSMVRRKKVLSVIEHEHLGLNVGG